MLGTEKWQCGQYPENVALVLRSGNNQHILLALMTRAHAPSPRSTYSTLIVGVTPTRGIWICALCAGYFLNAALTPVL